MLTSLDQFRESLKTDSEAQLRQRLKNSQASPKYAEHATIVSQELSTRFPGWDAPKTHRGGSRRTIVRFQGGEHKFETARAAYIWLVERFAVVNPSLFTDLRAETTGYVAFGRRKGSDGAARNYFARKPANLFRRTPTLADNPNNFHRLPNGWYVNLNLNTRENFEILCRFAAVSKLVHGQDWDWEVTDPTDPLHDARQRVLQAKAMEREMDAFFAQLSNDDTQARSN
jgi:hypothetical protein